MKSAEVDDAMRCLNVITGEVDLVIIGSQSLHGTAPDVADEIMVSREVDVILPHRANLAKWVDEVVGQGTPFESERGYFIDHIVPHEGLPVLASGWEDRLLVREISPGVRQKYLSPEDLVIATLAAAREKDRIFVSGMIRRELVTRENVELLLPKVADCYRVGILAQMNLVDRYSDPNYLKEVIAASLDQIQISLSGTSSPDCAPKR